MLRHSQTLIDPVSSRITAALLHFGCIDFIADTAPYYAVITTYMVIAFAGVDSVVASGSRIVGVVRGLFHFQYRWSFHS